MKDGVMGKKGEQREQRSAAERRKADVRKEERRREVGNAVEGLPFTVRPVRA